MNPSVLMRNDEVVEQPVNQDTLTRRYTEEATKFIRDRAAAGGPFFLYLAHSMPHWPVHASDGFRGKSERGIYGDAVEEIDWSIGQVLDAIREAKIDDRTLVIFTSDNGPWLSKGEQGGSATPLRGGKMQCFEGGMRVPCIVRWPGHVPGGVTERRPLSQIDFLPTIAALAGATLPTDRVIDGKDFSPVLLGQPGVKDPHDALLYFHFGSLFGVRSGKWKLAYEPPPINPTAIAPRPRAATQPTFVKMLYNLEEDVGEQKDVARDHPDIVARLEAIADAARHEFGDRRLKIDGTGVRPVGKLDYDPRAKNPASQNGAGE
jgi:arylsulfatase A-like enzyme